MNYEELAKGLVIRWLKRDKEEFILKEDILNEEDKRKILEEIDNIINNLKEERNYKRKSEELQKRLDYLSNLNDCDEEFEL